MDVKLIKLVAFVLGSARRKEVVEKLYELKATTPTKLSEKCGLPMGNMSNILKELSREELVVCVNPEVRKNRIYCLTDLGEKVHDNFNLIHL